MDTKSLIAVIVMVFIFFVLIGTMATYELHNQRVSMELCLKHGGSWIKNNTPTYNCVRNGDKL